MPRQIIEKQAQCESQGNQNFPAPVYQADSCNLFTRVTFHAFETCGRFEIEGLLYELAEFNYRLRGHS